MLNRSFNITLFDLERFESLRETLLNKPNFQYIICAKEKAPTTGKEHIHIFVQYNKPVRFNPKEWETAHVEGCKGSPEQNYKYVTKEGDVIYEKGEMKTKKNKSSFPSIQQVKEMSIEERNQLPLQYAKIVSQMNTEENNDIDVDEYFKEDIQVYYLWGKSGIGKTREAIKLIKEKGFKKFNEVKFVNGFWIGLGNSEVALYDDFRDSHMKASEFINFIDYNVHNLNTKYGYCKNKYKLIIITSIQDPMDIYRNMKDEEREQWIRRLNIININ